MELAENVGGRTHSFAKSESLDQRFKESDYLVSEGGKSRLRGYLCTFGCLILCGLLLVGGGVIFIYESVAILTKTESHVTKNPAGRMLSAPLQDEQRSVENSNEDSKEFQIIAFVFIAVGAVMFMVGVPFTSRFYRRYRNERENEKSPILGTTNKEKGGRIYTPRDKGNRSDRQPPASKPPGTEDNSSCSKTASTSDKLSFLNKKANSGKRRKSKTGWMYRSPQRISNETFRFASHRHPSMNHIQLDGSNIFGRFESPESSSETSSDEELQERSPKKNSDIDPNRKSFQGFVNKIFRRREGDGANLVKNELTETGDDETQPPNRRESISNHSKNSVYEETTKEMFETEKVGSSKETTIGQGGLYNLG